MKTKILLIACFATVAIQSFAQEKHYRTDQYIDRLNQGEVDFTPPKGFSESQIDVKDVRSVFPHTIPSKGYLALLSNDKQCLAVYSELYSGLLVGKADFPTRETTWAQAKAAFIRSVFTKDLALVYGPDVKLTDHLTVYSTDKAEYRFNADSVYIYSLPIQNENMKPYTYGVCIMTMRFPSKLIGIYLFLTEKGYKKIDKYISKIDRSVLYHDTPKDPNGIIFKAPSIPTWEEIFYHIK